MTKSRHIPLNPCDYCIFGQHRVWRRQSGLGNFPYMVVDARGRCDPDALRRAVVRCVRRHPVLAARLVLSPFRLRPAWRVVGDDPYLLDAAERAVETTDLTRHDDAGAALSRCFEAHYRGNWYRRFGPQIRVEHYALPDDRTWIVLRWPHFLMDAEGAQRVLALWDDRHGDAPGDGEGQDRVPPDDAPVHIGRAIARRARSPNDSAASRGADPPADRPFRHVADFSNPARTTAYHVLHRHWTGQTFAEVRQRAKDELPPGPALHARFLAAAVCRAQRRLYAERRVETAAFYITFPMQVGASRKDRALLARRPLIGNYLVAPTICIPVDIAADRAALDAALLEQINAYLAADGDFKQWALLKKAAMLHHWTYDMIFKLPLDVLRASSGFSYYRSTEVPLASIGEARVENIWGGGPTTTPPAWNPVFSSFGPHLNLSLTYSEPAIAPELAARYIELIENELLDRA